MRDENYCRGYGGAAEVRLCVVFVARDGVANSSLRSSSNLTSSNYACDGGGVLAVLDDDHLLLGGSKRDLANLATVAKLVLSELGETGDDPGAGGEGDELR